MTKGGKPHVRVTIRGRKFVFPLTADGRSYLKPTSRWYGKYRDGNGELQCVPLARDKAAAAQLLAKLELQAERQRKGLIDPTEAHGRRTLNAHLDEYAAILQTKGDSEDHIKRTRAYVAAVLQGCGFVFPADVDVGSVAKWLNSLRNGRPAVELPAGVELFTMKATAALLEISRDALADHVVRHRLDATGHGRARRITRASVQFLADRAARGVGPSAINHYITSLRGFFSWLLKAKRIASNPLDTMELVPEETDIRRNRRELSADEMQRMLETTRASQRTFRDLTGEDRHHIYLAAAVTGFRANAVANLTAAHFHLDATPPYIDLTAKLNKSKKLKVQPIPKDIADSFRTYMTTRPATGKIWPGTWHPVAAEMMRVDLEAVGIPYCVEGPNGPEFVDFHALRHSFITLLGREGVSLATIQELAGHSTPVLTMRYMHTRMDDLAGAVEKLPSFGPSLPATKETGILVPILVPPARVDPHEPAPICTTVSDAAPEEKNEKGAANAAPFINLHPSAPECIEWSLPGLNRGPSDFQSGRRCGQFPAKTPRN
ncbi:tyrosine-type recombinase/integrase [Limnoglobus roseus]|uniref:tyrosine-type recombinase/integrase n=1 Tax=Limnoglobus roseus TaxID=2598579 RepID=UPI00143D3E43|nr:tyrosine-type recombinase/integrase [Limnoglobus roseus]